MALHRKADTTSARKAIHYLGEFVRLVDVEEGTVVAGDVVESHGFACGHECPHRGHYLQIENGVVDKILVSPIDLGRRVEHEVAVAVHAFRPRLAPMFRVEVARVSRQVDELLVRCGEDLHVAP